MSKTTTPPSWSSWHWSGKALSTSRNICHGNHSSYEPTTIHSLISWQHQTWMPWGTVELSHSLTQYTFDIEYQKGHDNMVADVLCRITTRLYTETVKSILDGVSMGEAQWASTYNPSVIKAGDEIDKQTQERAVHTLATRQSDRLGGCPEGRSSAMNHPGLDCWSEARRPEEAHKWTCWEWRGMRGPSCLTEANHSSGSTLISNIQQWARLRRFYNLSSPKCTG